MACKNFLFCRLHFHFIGYICCAKAFIWCSLICQVLLLLLVLFDVLSKKLLPRPRSRNIFPVFSCRSFVVPALMFQSYTNIQLIFVSAVRWSPNTLLCLCLSGFPNTICWLSIGCSWLPCQILVDHISRSLIMVSLFCSFGLYVYVPYSFKM